MSKQVMQLKACSRSEAEQYIAGGWVQVDGVVVEEPAFRVLRQRVVVDPSASLLNLTPITLVLHKPAGLTQEKATALLGLATLWAQDASGTRPLKRHFSNLESAVPLENGASGLLVFTQDWRTTRKLTEDMDAMEHELIAEVRGEVGPEALQKLDRALNNERDPLPHAKCSIGSSNPESSKLRFAIKGAHPGLVAYLCEKTQLELLGLRRIRLGRVALRDLPVGQWRYLTGHERF
ncbi:RNA-binding protein [Rhodoferax saidenbachensis]|uniref:Dual-specificity RNA pseudouridine synthase RluF n=1 Tax=Rhodoferax saidenbachensis TaxID=1484693 RepID=A0A1P8KG23_9BURK|nr:RNA-binding protein [Rhodoferax saidenbachensis]